MKSLPSFLRNFLKNQGQYILASLLIGKICAFLSSLFIIKLLPIEDFGKMSIVAAVFAIFSSCAGFGSNQSLLRYGSISESQIDKEKLSAYLLRQGFIYQLVLTVIFLVCSLFYLNKYEDIIWIFIFFAVRFLGFYFFNYVQTELRINNKNREFAKLNNVINIAGLFVTLVLTYFFELKGYLIAIALIPFLCFFWYERTDLSVKKVPNIFNSKEIWKYAFHTSGTTVLSDALFSLDILLLGFLLNESYVADYRVAILIPSNVTFLALAFMQSDFPVLAKNYNNKTFLKGYISGYYRFFIPVCLVIFFVCTFYSKDILKIFFNEKYAENSLLFVIFTFTFLMNILFRNLYGNLMSAVGKMVINTNVSLLSLPLLIMLSFILVPKYHLMGMTISVSVTLVFSGFFLAFFFYKYLKELK
ncbi:oligosaccharide flippase family protein [Chryseobacterium polytrichastri]|uniref:Membrane protein involved in the export of O-antigen and teichoic acid n=1 Tax=Chryseobacterium polytrichastri TaxID=1302687 RepID=A0A1M6YJJ5_9FLAO|nr:oligosaccharide flippase family protein [Chryseobacterium polytrichastri]SHL18303.1 Membrane protein involved in the export of O-antigen and teichoic acid [Chryseobacterium polytrichastri]